MYWIKKQRLGYVLFILYQHEILSYIECFLPKSPGIYYITLKINNYLINQIASKCHSYTENAIYAYIHTNLRIYLYLLFVVLWMFCLIYIILMIYIIWVHSEDWGFAHIKMNWTTFSFFGGKYSHFASIVKVKFYLKLTFYYSINFNTSVAQTKHRKIPLTAS
jgi:hypothetical protein